MTANIKTVSKIFGIAQTYKMNRQNNRCFSYALTNKVFEENIIDKKKLSFYTIYVLKELGEEAQFYCLFPL